MSRKNLSLEEKASLIIDNEHGISYRRLGEQFQVSLGAVSNILKRKSEYKTDYEADQRN